MPKPPILLTRFHVSFESLGSCGAHKFGVGLIYIEIVLPDTFWPSILVLAGAVFFLDSGGGMNSSAGLFDVHDLISAKLGKGSLTTRQFIDVHF